MNIKKYIIAFTTIALLWGCESNFLDINEDPNNPVNAPLNGLLPNIQYVMTDELGMRSNSGGLSNYVTHLVGQHVTRGNLSDYGLSGADFGVTDNWNDLYRSPLQDIKTIESTAAAQGGYNYLGIAQILKAYIYVNLVDLFGDVPYSEANLGALNINPRYDNSATVYDSCFALLDRAIANLQRESSVPVGPADLFYGGDAETWVKVANTLKLRMYTQMSRVEDVSAIIPLIDAEIASGPTDFTVFLGPNEDWELSYGTSSLPDNRNPLYAGEWAPQGSAHYIDPFFYEVMRGENSFFPNEANPYTANAIADPRLPYYFYNQMNTSESPENPWAYWNPSTGFLSIYGFSFNIDPNEGFDQASSQTIIGLWPGGGAYDDGSGIDANYNGVGTTPQRLLTHYNMYFNRAELALIGVTSEDPREMFELGVNAAFDKLNTYASEGSAPTVDATARTNYINAVLGQYDAAPDADGRLEMIMIEKWKANYGMGIVAYNDYRRTGYPLLHDGDTDVLTVTDRQRDYPWSLPWNIGSLDINSSAPAQKQVTDKSKAPFWVR